MLYSFFILFLVLSTTNRICIDTKRWPFFQTKLSTDSPLLCSLMNGLISGLTDWMMDRWICWLTGSSAGQRAFRSYKTHKFHFAESYCKSMYCNEFETRLGWVGRVGVGMFFCKLERLDSWKKGLVWKTHNLTNATDSHNYPCSDWHALHLLQCLVALCCSTLVKLLFFGFFSASLSVWDWEYYSKFHSIPGHCMSTPQTSLSMCWHLDHFYLSLCVCVCTVCEPNAYRIKSN